MSSSESLNSRLAPLAVFGAVAVTAGVTTYLAWPARNSRTSPAKRQALIAYLHDHLGGSDVAIRVVRRLAETLDGTEDGALCRRLANEFEHDRSIVRSLLAQLGASGRSIKRAAGSASGSLLSVAAGGAPGDLSLLRTLEGLAIGIQGKRCMWRALQDLSGPPIDYVSFTDLEAKAVRQWDAVEQRRRELVTRTFATSDARGW